MFSRLNAVIVAGLVALTRADSLIMKPHVLYGSSVGVLGCKIDPNRVAYWPSEVDCDAICVKVSHGKSALEAPATGGGVQIDYEFVKAEECVAQNYQLYNIPQGNDCLYSYDEICILDLALGHNPVCPHTLGFPAVLEGHAVVNIPYPTK
ncbi:hypothetical protein LY78DRAFT_708569 [Colletotrichum sublineola]|nr:hypothetical protein LY78DRAFT_708569 [Colletotrichum sublineola]